MTLTLPTLLHAWSPLLFLVAGLICGYVLGNRDRAHNPRIPRAPRVPDLRELTQPNLGSLTPDEDAFARRLAALQMSRRH